MPAIQSLDELEQYLRVVMPQSKSIQHLQKNGQYGFIDFRWNGHHFAVKPTLEAFEVKDNRLFITAGSLLLQSALVKRTSNEATVAAIAETLEKAEDLMRARPDEGMALVSSVKRTIEKMITRR